MTRNSGSLLLIAVFSLTLYSSQVQQKSQTGYAYFFDCSGKYVRVDTATYKIIAESTLWDATSAEKIRPLGGLKFDGCLLSSMQYAQSSGIVYTAIAKEGAVDLNGARHYRLVALRVPNFSLEKIVDIPFPLEEDPTLVVVPLDNQLLVGLRQDGGADPQSRSLIQHYRVSDLAYLRSVNGSYFVSDAPYWDERSGFIIDASRVLSRDGRIVEREVDGYTLLSESVRTRFSNLRKQRVGGEPYFDVCFLNSSGGRMLFGVSWDTRYDRASEGSGLIVYDVSKQDSFTAIRAGRGVSGYDGTRGTPTAYLNTNGALVILEVYNWQSSGPGQNDPRSFERYKTGEIRVYPSEKAGDPRSVNIDPAPGFFGNPLGFYPSHIMYYYANSRIYVLDLAAASTSRQIQLPKSFVPQLAFFADR